MTAAQSALVFRDDLRVVYPGTQDDERDAQRDMACASIGALVATA